MKLMMSRCTNAEIFVKNDPNAKGTPFAWYAFFTSLLYISASEGGNPINAPIVTVNTDMDWIRVSLLSGITDVKIPPITAKNRSGTA